LTAGRFRIIHYSPSTFRQDSMISTEEHPSKTVAVNGKRMAYVEMGEGDPIVFLHGNPTSSYLWRNIMPYVSGLGRCLAPDLIGMGQSEKLDNPGPDSYRFVEHREYLDGFFSELGLDQNVTLVLHDWGSALGFDWARRHPTAVTGIAYMESIVRPVTWDEWNADARPVFEAFRSPAGENMVLEKNIFIERVLPGSVLRKMSDAEMDVYRRPFLNAGEDRRPTLTWPRQIPIDGEPAEVNTIVSDYANWMAENEIAKLFINAEPGAILIGAQREFCRSWKNQTEITVKGSHFIQEDSPKEIGEALANWLPE
jgi:haloalkane dehalogenase